ncbi:putative NACHT domain-containing protein [Seiridium cardinale]
MKIGDQNTSASISDKGAKADESANRLCESMKELEVRRASGHAYKILHRLSPFIENLKSLMQICESVIQDAPFGVSIAFSGARVVLDLAFRVHSQFETILEAMEEIGARLECYKLLAKYDSRPNFQRLLLSAYKNIIQFWLKASQILSQNSLKSMVKNIAKPLHTIIKDTLDHLSKDGDLVHQYASATGLSNAKDDQEERRKERSEDTQKDTWQNEKRLSIEISAWIRGHDNLDPNIDYEDQLNRRHEGTCDWVLDDQRFKDWRDSKNGELMWYNASPGSGKSVLASSVIKHLKTRDEKVAMFFYSFSSLVRRSGIHGLRSLALQLLTMTPRLPDKFKQLYDEQRHYSDCLQSYVAANEFLQHLIIPLDHIYLVVDGLDECSDMGLVLPILQSLTQAKVYGTVKWLFLSRGYAEIREAMTGVNAIELCPEPHVISTDIQKYVTSSLTCVDRFNEWSDEDEQNFLYARFVCETLRRVGLTRAADTEPALKQFPGSLNSYYNRSLEDFGKYSKQEQELVRRVFVILVGAEQSIRLRELVDALSIELGADDHDDSYKPQAELIERFCGPIITLERHRKDSLDNPIVGFYHKTVKDFLLQSPQDIDGISSGACQYLVTHEDAQREDINALLSTASKEHAFLPYAATFWFSHLWHVKSSKEIPALVMDFLKSKAFWTCLVVQSHISRYLFGSFTQTKEDKYKMDFKASKGGGSLHFGHPLPPWLRRLSTEGMLMDQSLCCFVDEWHEVITRHSSGLELCFPLRNYAKGCYLKPLSRSKKLRVEFLPDFSDMNAVAESRLLNVCIQGKRLMVEASFRKRENVEHDLHIARSALLPTKDTISSRHYLPLVGDPSQWVVFNTGADQVEGWGIDPRSLNVRRTTAERSEQFEIPPSARKHIDKKSNKLWSASQAPAESSNAQIESVYILHARREVEEVAVPSPIPDDEDSASDSDSSWPDSESESETEDGSLSDAESSSQGSSSRRDSEASDSDPGPEDDGEEIGNCLVLVQPDRPPYWTRPWASSFITWEKVGCAIHPTLPILAFTHTSFQLEMVDIEKRTQDTKHLPEPVDIRGKPEASTRELRFSPCGKYLHCLSISFVSGRTSNSCYVTLASYCFKPDGNSDETFIRAQQPIQLTYCFSERVSDIAPPPTLTYWSENNLLLALPPLTCDAKIILIDIPRDGIDGNMGIKTLRAPIYFPASTPKRQPHVLQRHGSDGREIYLYLVLGALPPLNRGDGSADLSTEVSPDIQDGANAASPPVALQWRVPQQDGWRAWDADLDEKSSDLKRQTPAWAELRGDFVQSEKPFSVPIRSGLDWNRRGYLSC